jgi:signal transduction histidine kinase
VAEDKAHDIIMNVPEHLTLNGDSNRLAQAVANLIDNAIKYTPAGGRITLSGWANNGEVALSVADTGIGISSQEMEKVWDRLFRADRSRARRGLGLGLTMVKAIIEAHGGRVALRSELHHGSVFTIYLPAIVHHDT